MAQGYYEEATAFVEESLSIYREIAEPRNIAASLALRGEIDARAGQHASGEARLEEGLLLFRAEDDHWGIGYSLATLALIAWAQGDILGAGGRWTESLKHCWQVRTWMLCAEGLEGLAGVAGALRRPDRAARLFGAAQAFRTSLGTPLAPVARPVYERNLARARAQLDEPIWAAAWAEGQALSLDQVVAYALDSIPESEPLDGARSDDMPLLERAVNHHLIPSA